MKLDVVVPTYNRSGLLQKTLASLFQATVPPGLDVSVLVIDNNSPDDTAEMVQRLQAETTLPLRYIPERKQGLSHARNAGIAASSADLIGFIDDDEEIDATWYSVVAREFADPSVHFIGGPYLPNWVTPVPDWLPPGYHAAIGAIPPKPRSLFGKSLGANLMGGNAVIRREVFSTVGTYAPHLGRSSKGLLSEEDAEFYRRLDGAGMKGIYVPDLLIYHFIAPDRLTRTYHRRWVLWRAISQGLLDRELPEAVPYFGGVPRYKIGKAIRSLLTMPAHRLQKGGKGQAFADELASWDLAGFIYGKHFFKMEEYYSEKKSGT
ncbi:MAG TPA: glycosyltransferase [Acidobacteriaceae bacterium]|nr:glycosyltransferase [Acidobacteriaceae bacterium]